MRYSFATLTKELDQVREWFSAELVAIHTGQATPAFLDQVTVEVYGVRTPLTQVATISTEGAKVLRVVPWDAANVKKIEKAITDADLGVSVGADERGVRVVFPDLTGERREALKKKVKEKLEEARVRVRRARDDAWSDIQKKQREGEMSEDEKYRAKEEMEKIVREAGEALQEAAARKEKELSF